MKTYQSLKASKVCLTSHKVFPGNPGRWELYLEILGDNHVESIDGNGSTSVVDGLVIHGGVFKSTLDKYRGILGRSKEWQVKQVIAKEEKNNKGD